MTKKMTEQQKCSVKGKSFTSPFLDLHPKAEKPSEMALPSSGIYKSLRTQPLKSEGSCIVQVAMGLGS